MSIKDLNLEKEILSDYKTNATWDLRGLNAPRNNAIQLSSSFGRIQGTILPNVAVQVAGAGATVNQWLIIPDLEIPNEFKPAIDSDFTTISLRFVKVRNTSASSTFTGRLLYNDSTGHFAIEMVTTGATYVTGSDYVIDAPITFSYISRSYT
jgi:hypothetical protein